MTYEERSVLTLVIFTRTGALLLESSRHTLLLYHENKYRLPALETISGYTHMCSIGNDADASHHRDWPLLPSNFTKFHHHNGAYHAKMSYMQVSCLICAFSFTKASTELSAKGQKKLRVRIIPSYNYKKSSHIYCHSH